MKVLLHSAVVYLFGVALILYVKPTLMFRADGQWKEFGTMSVEHTVFPFWLFCIVWAVVSYILMLYILGGEGGGEAVMPLTTSAALAAATSGVETTPEDLVPVLPTKTKRRRRVEEPEVEPQQAPRPTVEPQQAPRPTVEPQQAPRPGYYKLNKAATARNGAPKYIYIGNELDERSDVETDGD